MVRDADPEVVDRRSRRRLWRMGLVCLGVVGASAAAGCFLLRLEPAFYSAAVPHPAGPTPGGGEAGGVGNGGDAESLSRRLVTKAAGWRAAIGEAGPWEAAVTAAEVNGWLACDLPKNHPRLLPRGVSQPRVAFEPRHLLGAARIGYGPFTAVAWVDLEIVLRDVNHLSIVVDRARLGAVPVPRATILRELERRIGRLGLVTDLRILDDRPVLMVYIPSTHAAGAASYRLESFVLGDGELLLAGQTRSATAAAARADPP